MQKKFWFLLLVIFLSATGVHYGQERNNKLDQYLFKDTLHLYLKFSGGYSFPLATANLNNFVAGDASSDGPSGFYNSTTTFFQPASTYSYSVQTIDVSFGKGGNIYGNLGCKINKHFSVEIGGGYVYGAKFTATAKECRDTNSVLEFSGSHVKQLYSREWLFDASLVISGKEKRMTPYAKIGGLFSIPVIYYDEKITGVPICHPPYEELSWKYYGGWAAGAEASGGLIYNIRKSFQVFAEAKIIALSYAPLKGKMTKFIVNGVNRADTIPPEQSNLVYSKNLNWNRSAYPPSNQQLLYHFPFNSWGVNVGMKINIRKTYYRKKPQ